MTRRPLDYYPTDPALTRVMLNRMELPKGLRILEPSAGDGAIANVLREEGFDVITNDIDPQWGCDHTSDFLDPRMEWDGIDAIIGNPPYSHAPAFIRRALQVSDLVVMLLRLTFLEPCDNRRGLVRGMSRCLVLQRCPFTDFTGGGGDSTTVAWCGWDGEGRTRRGPDVEVVYKDEIERAAGQLSLQGIA